MTRWSHINSLGFRGEALPSIGAVSRLSLTSITADLAHAWRVVVDGGRMSDPQPAALAKGSMISVTQLFKVVPARLKFLKTERTEQGHVWILCGGLPLLGHRLDSILKQMIASVGFASLFARTRLVYKRALVP